ncbi:hypothetical protein KIH87_11175 [Paraneptunicella aestuarii]|uniref:hypothetical protein n=1 Tax=Paraneptunicella aestuarii TaxID=2831148 RepID=UPI001E607321|nr:hypothetical protein [Paraneptunicella aestuarii]UAA37293.1 hypothetical protein KIH87_11175 [Paraneptunicella aestuarii]
MVFYPTYIFIDVTTVLLIIFKIPLLSYWENFQRGSFDAKQYCITRADFLLVGIYAVYLFVTMMSFIEHWYRHIEDLPVLVDLFEYLFQFESIKGHYAQYGIYDVHSLTEYFFLQARHVYDAAPTFKAYFNILEHASILATSYKFMQSNHIVKV